MQFVLAPAAPYLLLGEPIRQLRRIYTDGRPWPTAIAPTFSGYSIGRWEGDDGQGHAAALVVETRGLRGPRSYDSNGAPFHAAHQAIVEERMQPHPPQPAVWYDDLAVH